MLLALMPAKQPILLPPFLQVAVCTPGRMIDLIKMKACTMKRATYLVSCPAALRLLFASVLQLACCMSAW